MRKEFLIGNDLSSARIFEHKLIFMDSAGNELDCSIGFADEDVETSENIDNAIHSIPGRVLSHVYSGSQQTPGVFRFRAPIWSLEGDKVENSFVQIRDFFYNAPGGLVDIYWLRDNATGYKAYLPACLLKSVSEVRRHIKRMREFSYVQITVESLAKRWRKVLAGDAEPSPYVVRSSDLITTATNDGSTALAIVYLDNDGVFHTVAELTDEGDLFLTGQIKTNRDLGTWDLDLENL